MSHLLDGLDIALWIAGAIIAVGGFMAGVVFAVWMATRSVARCADPDRSEP